jgi:hypothetical protein
MVSGPFLGIIGFPLQCYCWVEGTGWFGRPLGDLVSKVPKGSVGTNTSSCHIVRGSWTRKSPSVQDYEETILLEMKIVLSPGNSEANKNPTLLIGRVECYTT